MVHNCPVVSRGANLSVADRGQVNNGHVHGVGEAPALEHHVPQHADNEDRPQRKEDAADPPHSYQRFVYCPLGDGPIARLAAFVPRHGQH
jgi:hypothetical protein